MAPEIITQAGHGRQADIWSIGCTVIEMFTAKPPWSHIRDQMSAMFHIANSTTGPPIPDHISAEAKDFLRLCFARVPGKRPNCARLLRHPFVATAVPRRSPVRTLLIGNQFMMPSPVTEVTEISSHSSSSASATPSSGIIDSGTSATPETATPEPSPPRTPGADATPTPHRSPSPGAPGLSLAAAPGNDACDGDGGAQASMRSSQGSEMSLGMPAIGGLATIDADSLAALSGMPGAPAGGPRGGERARGETDGSPGEEGSAFDALPLIGGGGMMGTLCADSLDMPAIRPLAFLPADDGPACTPRFEDRTPGPGATGGAGDDGAEDDVSVPSTAVNEDSPEEGARGVPMAGEAGMRTR